MGVPEIQSRYNLITGANELVSQLAQSPNSSRQLINFIPSVAGHLKRKPYSPPMTLGDPPNMGWFSFVRSFLFFKPTRARIVIVGESTNIGSWLHKWKSSAGAYDASYPPNSTTV